MQNQWNYQLVIVYIMSDISSQVKELKMNRIENKEVHSDFKQGEK